MKKKTTKKKLEEIIEYAASRDMKVAAILSARGGMIPSAFIFNHDFAKAVFREEEICSRCLNVIDEDKLLSDPPGIICNVCAENANWDDNVGDLDEIEAWQYHLQQLVLLETDKDRIDYIFEYIKNAPTT